MASVLMTFYTYPTNVKKITLKIDWLTIYIKITKILVQTRPALVLVLHLFAFNGVFLQIDLKMFRNKRIQLYEIFDPPKNLIPKSVVCTAATLF